VRISDLLASVLPHVTVSDDKSSDRTGTDRIGGSALWLSGDDAPLFRLVRAGGRDCLWHADRIADIAGDLDAAQPLLDAVEGVTGWRFEPAAARDLAPDHIIALDDGETCLEIAADGVEAPGLLIARASGAPPRGDIARPTSFVLLPAPIEVSAAAALEAGDLVLIGSPLPARLSHGSGAEFAFDLAMGALSTAAREESVSPFGVAIELKLPPLMVAPDALDSARRGEAVRLGSVREGTQVALALGADRTGSAQLVRLGTAWAARIESLVNSSAEGLAATATITAATSEEVLP